MTRAITLQKSLRTALARVAASWSRPSPAFLTIVLLLVAAFLFGGSSRGDVPAALILRPAAILALGIGLWQLRASHVAAHRFLVGFAAAVIAILLLHLVKLPPAFWIALPGHRLIAGIDASAGIADIWRPLSIAPELTRDALFASLVPLAVLVLGIQLSEPELFRLLPVLLVLGAISATTAVMQIVSGADIPQPLYSDTTERVAVGLFVNRNFQALTLALMFPMIACAAANAAPSSRSDRAGTVRAMLIPLAASACALCLIVLLLITGSRAGIIVGLAALASVPLLLFRASARRAEIGRGGRVANHGGRFGWAVTRVDALRTLAGLIVIAILVVVVLVVAYVSGRTEAFDRLRTSAIADDLRLRALPTLWIMLGRYWPTGSGLGTFEKAYFIDEPDGLLGPVFMNHAHNDWLEVVITAGLGGLVLLVAAVVAFVWRAYRAFSERQPSAPEATKTVRFVCLGLVIMALSGLASVGDYPLRVPALACVFVVAALWADCRFTPERSARLVVPDTI